MAPNEIVEIRLVCKGDYLDPQLKVKLHEIRNKLRDILHTGRRRFAIKKVQPWNSVKVTLDIPKEAADRLHLLAVQGNARLIELGILTVEIVGQSNPVSVNTSSSIISANNNNAAITTTTNPPTNSKELSIQSSSSSSAAATTTTTTAAVATPGVTTKLSNDSAESTAHSSLTHNFPYDNKAEDHRHKRVKIENENDQQNYAAPNNFPYKNPSTVNLMQPPLVVAHPAGHYMPQQTSQIVNRQPIQALNVTSNYGRMAHHPNSISPTHPSYINTGKPHTLSGPTSVSASVSAPTPPPPPPPYSYQCASTTDNTITGTTTNITSNGLGNDMHNYHHHDSWSNYIDHSNNYKIKVNGVRNSHYYPQQQQLITSDGPSTSSTMYCTQQQTQYDMRRCETNVASMAASSTNMQNSYDGTSS